MKEVRIVEKSDYEINYDESREWTPQERRGWKIDQVVVKRREYIEYEYVLTREKS